MREHFKGVILVILLGLFALAGALIPGTQVAYAHEISIVLTLIAVALGYRIYLHGIRSLRHGNVTAQLFATIAIFISVVAGSSYLQHQPLALQKQWVTSQHQL